MLCMLSLARCAVSIRLTQAGKNEERWSLSEKGRATEEYVLEEMRTTSLQREVSDLGLPILLYESWAARILPPMPHTGNIRHQKELPLD